MTPIAPIAIGLALIACPFIAAVAHLLHEAWIWGDESNHDHEVQ